MSPLPEISPQAAHGRNLAGVLDLREIAKLAQERLAPAVWDFVAGGAEQELTIAANRAAIDELGIVPRVLRDVSAGDVATSLFGRALSAPIVVAPIAYHQLMHPDGELATARAARASGIPLCVSTLSSCALEVIAAQGSSLWFQLYWLREPAVRDELVGRAEDAGCDALVVTVDVPWMGRRLRDMRNGFALAPDVTAANLPRHSARAERMWDSSTVVAHTADIMSPALTWADIEDLRTRTRLPLVLKGVLAPEDARRAVDCGVDGVVVSNHGGRQLDGVVSSIECLAAVRDAVGRECTVLFDSGVRSGVDVLKALALGADSVLVGRPVLHGLAVAGELGVHHVLELLKSEFRNALGLAGCTTVEQAHELHIVGSRRR